MGPNTEDLIFILGSPRCGSIGVIWRSLICTSNCSSV